jgi:leucyl aminopeptidase
LYAIMMASSCAALVFILSAQFIALGSADSQQVLWPPTQSQHEHAVSSDILQALEIHADPVEAFLYLHPEASDELAQPRLLYVADAHEPQWMTEGDKMRLRRQGKKFTDITDHEDFIRDQQVSAEESKARTSAFGNEDESFVPLTPF